MVIDLEEYLKLSIKPPKSLSLDSKCILINKANRVAYEKEKKDFNKLNKRILAGIRLIYSLSPFSYIEWITSTSEV